MSTDSGNRKYQALALGTSYALGTFNDNFFKQAAEYPFFTLLIIHHKTHSVNRK